MAKLTEAQLKALSGDKFDIIRVAKCASEHDAAHIERCSPNTIAALLSRLESETARADRLAREAKVSSQLAYANDSRAKAAEAENARLAAELAGASKESADATRYATRLLCSLMEKHFPDRSPNWRALPDLYGVLTQIDNLSTGLPRALAAKEAQ